MDYQEQSATTLPTSDEKLLAMLSHLSIFLGGVILPIIIWATQKDKSKFVRFHSLQAIFFHIAYVVIIVFFAIVFVGIMLVSGFGLGIFDASNTDAGEGMSAFVAIMMVVIYGGIFLLIFLGIGYGIFLAVKAYKGDLIKIPVIGNIVYKKVYGQAP